jgi:hypothetical protein
MIVFLREYAPLFGSTLSNDSEPVISAVLMSYIGSDDEWLDVQHIIAPLDSTDTLFLILFLSVLPPGSSDFRP